MYKAFNFRLNDDSEAILEGYLETGKKLYENMKINIDHGIDSFYTNGVIDVERLQGEWFPTVGADVFISHSGTDNDLAISLAGYLHERFGLESFVDSYIWGYMDSLLRKIDNKWCRMKNDTNYYDYKLRNRSTSHIHMVLGMSLTKMIDACECLIFLNTPNSVSAQKNIDGDVTNSPWICHEIFTANVIRKWKRRGDTGLQEGTMAQDSLPDFWYKLPTAKFDNINLNLLQKLYERNMGRIFEPKQWLDRLYDLFENPTIL